MTVDLSTPERADAEADPVELERALVNLLHNALKYAPPDSTVEVRLERAEQRWALSVRDHGPGIAPEAQAAIFGRGVQGPGAVEGFGLGLAIARRILAEHSGGLSAGNHPDGGAVFQAWLPAI